MTTAITNTTYSKQPRGISWRSNTPFIISTVAIGLFSDLFLYGLIVPILPFILRDRLSIPHSEIQRYTSILLACYAGASVLFSMPAGIIADKLPTRRLPFLLGLAALMLSTILLFVGQSICILILARIFQGMSAAVVWTVGLALVMDTVGSDKLGVTIGSIFSLISVGELAAPVLGGVVYQKVGSEGVFGMAFGLLAIDFFMRLLVIEKKVAARYGLKDTPADESHEEEEGNDGEEADEVSPLLRTNDDMDQWKISKDQPKWVRTFPIVYCLRHPRFIMAQAVGFAHAALLGMFDATIPTVAQDLFGFNALEAGVIFVPLVLPYLVVGPLAGIGVDKYGVKPAAVIGMGYLIIPLILLRIPHKGGTSEIIKYCAFLSLCGLGLATVSSPSIVEASYVVERYHHHNKDFFGEEGPYAQLYAISSMFFCLGLTFGPLIAGTLRDKIGYGNMNAMAAALCAVVSVLSFFFLGGKPKLFRRKA